MKKIDKIFAGSLAGLVLVGGLAIAGVYVAEDIKSFIAEVDDPGSSAIQWVEAYTTFEDCGFEGKLYLNNLVVLISDDNKLMLTRGEAINGNEFVTCYNEYEVAETSINVFDLYDVINVTQSNSGRVLTIDLLGDDTINAFDVIISGDRMSFCGYVLCQNAIPEFIDFQEATWQGVWLEQLSDPISIEDYTINVKVYVFTNYLIRTYWGKVDSLGRITYYDGLSITYAADEFIYAPVTFVDELADGSIHISAISYDGERDTFIGFIYTPGALLYCENSGICLCTGNSSSCVVL